MSATECANDQLAAAMISLCGCLLEPVSMERCAEREEKNPS